MALAASVLRARAADAEGAGWPLRESWSLLPLVASYVRLDDDESPPGSVKISELLISALLSSFTHRQISRRWQVTRKWRRCAAVCRRPPGNRSLRC
jgi:hypothetical protein